MSSFWRQWKRFIRINKKRRFFVFSLVGIFLILGAFGLMEPARAQSALTFGVNQLMNFATWVMFIVARLCIGLTIFALKFFIEIAEYNNYIDTATVKLGWLMVRDVANMFFVVVLLMISFGTILGIESYEWSKTLVKLVLAAVFINFSNLIAQLIIDVAHVFTMTFLNAISATAGGNLISMFKIDKIMAITGQEFDQGAELALELFAASVIAFLLALFMFLILGAYLIIMVARMVVLWVLIILSPLAYIFAVIPQTQEYANKWWSQFNKQVIVAPVIVFFLWLSFATLGSGTLAKTSIENGGLGFDLDSASSDASLVAGTVGGKQLKKLSISDASTWENLADYIVSLAFLFVGLKVVGELGVVGGGVASGFVSFGKSVAKIATGYMVGRWAYEKGMDVGKKAIGKGLYYMPLVGGEKIAMKAKNVGHAMRDWYYEKGTALSREGYGMQKKAEGIWQEQAKMREAIEQAKTPEEREALEKDFKPKQEQLQTELGELEKSIEKEYVGGILGKLARSGIKTEKQLAKTQKQADNRRLILWKQTGSEAGGNVFFGMGVGTGTKGLGFGKTGKFRIFGDRFQHDKELAKEVYGEKGITARDRVERGWLQAEEARSKAKDEEFEGMGKTMALGRARLKYDVKTGTLGFQLLKEGKETGEVSSIGSMLDQIHSHKLAADTHGEVLKRLEGEAKLRVIFGDVKPATVKGDAYGTFLEAKALAQTVNDTLKEREEEDIEDVSKDIYNAGNNIDKAGQVVRAGKYDKETRDQQTEVEKAEKELQALRQTHKVTLADGTEKTLAKLDEESKKLEEEMGEKQKKLFELKKAEHEKKKFDEIYPQAKKNRDDADFALAQAEEELKSMADDDPKKQKKEKEVEALKKKAEEAENDRKKIFDGKDETEKKIEEIGEGKTSENIKAEINELSKEVIEKRKRLDNEEAELVKKEGSPWKAKKDAVATSRDALEKHREDTLDKKKWRLLSGDTSVINEVLADIQEQLAEEEKKKEADQNKLKIKELKEEQKTWKKLLGETTHGSLAFRYGAAKGKKTDSSKGYRYAHNLLLSQAEQRVVHDGRGLDTPLSTLTEMIEESGKDFAEMSIESFVKNIGPNLLKMVQKTKDGTITQQERASLMGLYKRGFDRSWIDDAIYAIFNDEKARKQISDELGWEDIEYTDDKIRDIQMLFASGGDVDFVKNNAVMTHIEDIAKHKHKMDFASVLKGMNTGEFRDKNGTLINNDLKKEVEEDLVEKGVKLTTNQKELFESFFKEADQAAKDLRTDALYNWKKVVENRQSEFQFLGNLRSEALRNGHPENAGWALTQTLDDGQNLYVPRGVRSALAHVMGDARKMTARDRLAMQSHAYGYLDEDNDQVMTKLMLSRYTDLTTGANPRNFDSVNTRLRRHLLGLSASDEQQDFRDQDSFFLASKVRTKKGELSNAAKTWIKKLSKEEGKYGEEMKKAQTDEAIEAVMAMAQMDRLFADQMRGNLSLFVMNLAAASGMDSTQAAMDGNIKFKIFNPREGRVKEYTNISQLIEAYNNGDWEFADPTGKRQLGKGKEKISKFVPTKAEKEAKERRES